MRVGRFLAWPTVCLSVALAGCGGDDSRVAPLAPYPAGLSAESSPSEVAAVLIGALDADDNETLLGLVAVQAARREIEVIYERHGRSKKVDPTAAARLAVAGWGATYAFFQEGRTRIRGETVHGDTAVVTALGLAPNGRAKSLEIKLVREDGLWKVRPGLQSALAN